MSLLVLKADVTLVANSAVTQALWIVIAKRHRNNLLRVTKRIVPFLANVFRKSLGATATVDPIADMVSIEQLQNANFLNCVRRLLAVAAALGLLLLPTHRLLAQLLLI